MRVFTKDTSFLAARCFRVWLMLVLALAAQDRLLRAQEANSGPAQLRAAIEKALPLLERASAGFADNRSCFTCHSQALPVMAFAEAKQRGFEVDEQNLQRQIDHTAAHLKRRRDGYLAGKGQGGRVDTAGYALWTLEAGRYPSDEITTAVTEYLLRIDGDLGHWKTSSHRPPSEASDFTATYLALRGLQAFGAPEEESRIDERKASAAKWLQTAAPTDTEDRVFHLRSLSYIDADSETRKRFADELIQQQCDDGGWAQKPDLKSDAYATGTVLTALGRESLLSPSSEAYQRGLEFLLKSQLEDGSWRVVSRSKPFQEYFESGFPHEKDQFISTSATAWAVIAMLLALPEQASPDGPSQFDPGP